MNYTKGKWKVSTDLTLVYDENHAVIAHGINHPNKLAQENQANTRLIASAPDMYEALKEIWVMTAPKCHDSYIKSINDLCGKALAKAEGK